MKNRVNILLFLIISISIKCGSDNSKDRSITEIISSWDSSIVTKKYFSDNRVYKSQVYYKNRLLEELYYYENKNIKSYMFFGTDGWCYKRSYDNNGKLINTEGEPCYYGSIEGALNNDSDYYCSKDTLKLVFFAPTLSDCSTQFCVADEKDTLPNIFKIDDVSCGYQSTHYPLEPGTYQFNFIMNFRDKITRYQLQKEIKPIVAVRKCP